MTNYPFGGIDDFRDIEAHGQYAQGLESVLVRLGAFDTQVAAVSG